MHCLVAADSGESTNMKLAQGFSDCLRHRAPHSLALFSIYIAMILMTAEMCDFMNTSRERGVGGVSTGCSGQGPDMT